MRKGKEMEGARMDACAKALAARTPRMILFDYGGTLVYEMPFDTLRGMKALMAYAARNPRRVTPQEAAALSSQVFSALDGTRMEQGIEVHQHMAQRYMCERLGLGFDISPVEQETILWDAASPCAAMEGIEELLLRLGHMGIRTGVISNIMFSGEALTARLNRLLPQNAFEFIMASSDYVFRKPNRLLFELALQKADLPPEDVWFCGDTFVPDIEGAAGAGIFPVWFIKTPDGRETTRNCLTLNGWNQLTAALSKDTIQQTILSWRKS